MSCLKLYELPELLGKLQSEILDSDGEMTPDMESRLELVQETLEKKADGICSIIKQLLGEADLCLHEAQRLQALARSRTINAVRLKAYLLTTMQNMGIEKIQTDRFRISEANNPRPTITWDREPEELPLAYQRLNIELDGQIAYEVHKSGKQLPEGFTVRQGTHLRIT